MRGSPRSPGPAPPSCRQAPATRSGRGSSSRSCTSSRDASPKCSGPSPPEDPPHHAQRGHHHAPRARELLRDAARVRFHRHLPVPRQRLHVLSRTPLRERQADLYPFFTFHPWLYLFLIPAISMKLWSEERKSGSIELLMTQPVELSEAVLGKFLAAWIFTALALALTFPLWITVNYLGHPDNGAILTAYLGSIMLAGGFLAIGSCMSALTRNQVVAFILAVVACFMFLLAGFPLVLDVFRS